MERILLKSKIHRGRVTEANLRYEGSITIDAVLMKKADILPGEKVEILNINNGERLETYAIEGKADSGILCLNGAAARAACVGDEIIVLSYVFVKEEEARSVKPKILVLDERNRIKD
jgi:aspartate 1-decarboxylase